MMTTEDNGQTGLQQAEERDRLKREIQDARQEAAAYEAETKRKKAELKDKEKSLQEQLGAAPKGYSKAQWAQSQKDIDIINQIAGQVNEEWNKSRSAILQASKYLFEAKLGVKKIHGASWSYMCKEKLPFGIKTADRLVEIGGCEFIHTNADDLPAAYTTLYEIAKMDAAVRQKAFDDNEINASSWRKDIIAITNGVKKEERAKEDENKVRTLPIGILNVPVKFFQKEEGKKTIWLEEKVKLFQAQCVNALKDVMKDYKVDGAPNMIDFSKINQTLEKQAERAEKKVIVNMADEEAKLGRVIKKKIKEEVERQPSFREMYIGSQEKKQNMMIDLFSSNDLHYLIWSLKEVGDPDFGYWKTIETPYISAKSLQQMANTERPHGA